MGREQRPFEAGRRSITNRDWPEQSGIPRIKKAARSGGLLIPRGATPDRKSPAGTIPQAILIPRLIPLSEISFAKTGLSTGAGEGIRTLDPDLGKVVLY